MLDADRQRALLDLAQPCGAAQLRKVTLAGPRQSGLIVDIGLQLAGRLPEHAEWLSAVAWPCKRTSSAERVPSDAAGSVGGPGTRFTIPPSWSAATRAGAPCGDASPADASTAADAFALFWLSMLRPNRSTPAASPARNRSSTEAGGIDP